MFTKIKEFIEKEKAVTLSHFFTFMSALVIALIGASFLRGYEVVVGYICGLFVYPLLKKLFFDKINY